MLIRDPTLGGNKYFLTFIDDFSKYIYIYYIKSKSDVYTKFLHYKALVEKETSAKIQKIKADNRGEYNSEKFHQFCQKEGISIHYTVPYTPEQNGVAERLNLTLLNKVRSVLAESSLPKDL